MIMTFYYYYYSQKENIKEKFLKQNCALKRYT